MSAAFNYVVNSNLKIGMVLGDIVCDVYLRVGIVCDAYLGVNVCITLFLR